MKTVVFYRVDLHNGVTVEERPRKFYAGHPDLNRTVFKNLRRAKAAFSEMSKAEMDRLHSLQRRVRPLTTRDEIQNHAYSPCDPEGRRRAPVPEPELA